MLFGSYVALQALTSNRIDTV